MKCNPKSCRGPEGQPVSENPYHSEVSAFPLAAAMAAGKSHSDIPNPSSDIPAAFSDIPAGSSDIPDAYSYIPFLYKIFIIIRRILNKIKGFRDIGIKRRQRIAVKICLTCVCACAHARKGIRGKTGREETDVRFSESGRPYRIRLFCR